MSMWWNLSKAGARASWASGHVLGDALAQGAAQRRVNRGARAVARGAIGPWDPTPPPGSQGFLDFSGVARPEDISCPEWWFPLGRYVTPRHPWSADQPIGLPFREVNRHTAILGATRAGKTASLIAPWIVEGLAANYTVVALDIKGNDDLKNEIIRYRDATYPSARFKRHEWNYANPPTSRRWNFVRELDDDGSINAATEAICGLPRDNDPNRNFHLRDMKWARGLLELAHDSGLDLGVRDLLEILSDPADLDRLVRKYPQTRGAQRLRDLSIMDPVDQARATQFLATYFEVLNNDGFAEVTRSSRFDLRSAVFAPGQLLLVNAPVADGALSAVSSGLFLSQVIHRRLSAFGRNPPPMLLVIDEAARVLDRLDLGRLLSLAAGANVSVVIALQEIKQLPEDKRDEILANCGTTVVLGGSALSTPEYISKRLGTRIAASYTASETHGRGSGRSSGYTLSSSPTPVMGENELRSPPSGRFGAVVINNNISRRPILVDLTRPDLREPE